MAEATEAEFYCGQIFEGEYPPEAAIWCNQSGKYYIDEMAVAEGEKRRFRIVEIEPPLPSEMAKFARQQRDYLISQTDYLLAADYPIDADKLAEIKLYRQALRDVPEQEGFPTSINWPVAPEWFKSE